LLETDRANLILTERLLWDLDSIKRCKLG